MIALFPVIQTSPGAPGRKNPAVARTPAGSRAVLGNQAALRATAAPQRGRHVLQRKCDACENGGKTLQAKLAAGEPGDALEQEADAAADRVMRMSTPGKVDRAAEPALQRRAAPIATTPSVAVPSAAAPASVHQALRASGQPLDAETRAFMEPRFGRDFGAVRVHDGASAVQSARDVRALAYTVGSDVVFGAGQFQPRSPAGRQLLAHELAHVAQQTGPVPPRLQRAPDGAADPPAAQPQTAPAAGATAVKSCPFPSDFANEHDAGMAMMCVTTTQGENPVCNLTDKHFALLNDAKTDARRRVQRAKNRMYMTGGPEFAERTAQKIFTDAPPSAGTIKRTLERMENILLGNTLQFSGATCADPLCESSGKHAAAYESGLGKPVVFCPRSFLPSYLPELRRTVIHEAVHLSGIDIDPDKDENYCTTYTCDAKCQDTTTADAWALFIDCLGGQLPQAAP